KLSDTKFDLVLSDVRLPAKAGIEVLKAVKSKTPQPQVILMTGYAEVGLAVDAIKKGAFDYISKPVNSDKMLETIQNALATETGAQEKTTKKSTRRKKQTKSTTEPKHSKTLGSPEFISGIS